MRVLGADLLTVHVRLMLNGSTGPTGTSTGQAQERLIAGRIPAPIAGLPAR